MVLIYQLAFLTFSLILKKKVLNKCSYSFPNLSLSTIITSLKVKKVQFQIFSYTLVSLALNLKDRGTHRDIDRERGEKTKNKQKKPLKFCFRKICSFRFHLALLKNTCHSEKIWEHYVYLNHCDIYYIFIHSVNSCWTAVCQAVSLTLAI